MKLSQSLLTIGLTIGAISGCSTAQTPAGNTVNISKIDLKNAIQTEVCESYVLGFGPLGEERASPVEAMKKAGFTEVVAIDYVEHSYVIGRKRCAIVYGKK